MLFFKGADKISLIKEIQSTERRRELLIPW
jgi:hypothetical protein